jgi:hypothetical protein
MRLGDFGVSGAFKQVIKHGLGKVDTFELEHHGDFVRKGATIPNQVVCRLTIGALTTVSA